MCSSLELRPVAHRRSVAGHPADRGTPPLQSRASSLSRGGRDRALASISSAALTYSRARLSRRISLVFRWSDNNGDRGSGLTPTCFGCSDPQFWSGRRDSNPRPPPWQGGALPTEPRPRVLRERSHSSLGGPRTPINRPRAHAPDDPNPPSPRWDGGRLSAHSVATSGSTTITSWAMRSPFAIRTGRSRSRFTTAHVTSPR